MLNRKRLWLGAGGVVVFILTLGVGVAMMPRGGGRPEVFQDFLAFYTAGTFVREGKADRLYDLPAVRRFEQDLAKREGIPLGQSFGPWWNPPFYAWVFVPLAGLPYSTALLVWIGINLAALAVAIRVLIGMLPAGCGWRSWMLVPVLVVCCQPCISSLLHAQNTSISLLLLALTVEAWRRDEPFMAGLVGGLLFYKPQLAAAIAVVVVLHQGWRALLGYAVTGSMLLAATLATLPGTLRDFFVKMPGNLHAMQVERPYLWERHPTIKAFWRLALQGRGPGEMSWGAWGLTIVCVAGLGIGLAAVVRKAVRDRRERRALRLPTDRAATDRLIAATIVCMPLLMPFYFDYDLLLLAIPAVLWAGERVDRGLRIADCGLRGMPIADCRLPIGERGPGGRVFDPTGKTGGREQLTTDNGRWTVDGISIRNPKSEIRNPPLPRWGDRVWAAAFVWAMFNAPVAGRIGFNPLVVLTGALGAILIGENLRRRSVVVGEERADTRPAEWSRAA